MEKALKKKSKKPKVGINLDSKTVYNIYKWRSVPKN
jgi:hypothetical protein